VIDSEVFEDARRLLSAGADQELVLVFLRERGLDKIDSINSARRLLGKTTAEAKTLVDRSQAWSDRYESDVQLREAAREALRQLADSKSPDLPRIIFEDEDE
jgi:ribosomal protein L7/L12